MDRTQGQIINIQCSGRGAGSCSTGGTDCGRAASGAFVYWVRPGTGASRRHALLEAWYRAQIRDEVPDLVAKWERRLGVRVAKVHVQRMRTRWGSCNAPDRAIRLNTDLARKPRQCLEYIVVHEMLHLLVRNHGEAFRKLMDRHLRDVLNSEPLAHTEWTY